MTLCCEIIYFVGSYLGKNAHYTHRVAHVGVVEVKVLKALEMGYTLAEIDRRPADDAVHVVSFIQ